MSPAANLVLEEVPFAILELVKARILANRRRRQQAKPKPSTRPGAQFRKVGASTKEWRKPQYGAGVFSQPGNTGLAWLLFPDFGSGFNAGSRWRHDTTFEDLITDDDKLSFKVGCGDGSKWIDADVTLPGIAAWRNTRETVFTPQATDQITVGATTLLRYLSNPTGKFIRYINRSFTVDDSAIRYWSMPCGNGSCILIVHVRAAGSAGATASRATNAIYYDVAGSDGPGYWEVFPNFTEQVDLKRHNVSATGIAAFVVSQTDCRQIAVPAALQSALSTLLPDAPWNSAPSGLSGGLTPDFISLNAPSNEYWYEDAGLPGYYVRMLDALLYRPEHVRFGLSAEAMQMEPPYHQVDAEAYSPSLFSLLTEYAELLPTLAYTDDSIFDFNYAEFGNRLRDFGVPAPRDLTTFDVREQAYLDFATAVYEGRPGYEYPGIRYNNSGRVYLDPDRLLTSLRVVRANAQPELGSEQLSQDRAWSQVARLTLADSRSPVHSGIDNYRLLWHYDWGNPSYCRQQLLALGFTAADLTP